MTKALRLIFKSEMSCLKIKININIYKSVIATLIGVLGTLFMTLGAIFLVICFVSQSWENIIICLVFIIPGILLERIAAWLNEIICAKKFLRKLQKSGLDNDIMASVDVALAVYQNYPVKSVEKHIANLNPCAGEIIASSKKN